MANRTLNTRIKLRYASYAEWQTSTIKLLPGEVAVCYIGANNEEIKNTAPTVLFKVGDGTHTFKDLQWASARAADVYNWAKAENLIVEKEGTGNVVASISWDTENKKFVYTTASVATSEGLEALQQTVANLTTELNSVKERLTTAEGKITTIEETLTNKVDKSTYNSDKTILENSIAENTSAIETINGGVETEGSIAKAVADEASARTSADSALETKITKNADDLAAEIQRAKDAEAANKALIDANTAAIQTNTNAIEVLSNGVDPEKVDGVKDLIDYVNTHGTEVTGIKNDITELESYFEEGVAKQAKNADTLGGHDSDYFAVATTVDSRLDTIETQLGLGGGDSDTGSIAEQVADLSTRLIRAESDIDAAEGKITSIESTLENTATDIEGLDTRIKAIEDDYLVQQDKTELSNLITAEVSRATEAENQLAARIKTVEDDYLKSTDVLILDCGSYN